MSKILEIKHEIGQALSVRLRALGTVVPGSNPQVKRVFVAKGGVSPPPECEDHNRYFVDLVMDRHYGMKMLTRPFVSIRDQFLSVSDVFRLPREVALPLEYDFKRKPVNPREVPAGDGSGRVHLAFDTEPWDTIDDADQARAYFRDWRDYGRCLKTLADWDDWQDYYASRLAIERRYLSLEMKRSPVLVTSDGSVGVLQRLLLRAYMQGGWGAQRGKKESYDDTCVLFDYAGLTVTQNDVRNGTKGDVIDNFVPRTPRTEALIPMLRVVFSSLEMEKIFIPDSLTAIL